MTNANTKNFEKISQDAANISKENMEALQKCASLYAKGWQDCMTTYTSMLQSAAERQNKMFKDMLGKKTMNEVNEAIQSASQENFNEFMTNASKLSEQAIKIAMESFEPINQQMNKNMKKASENMAA